LKKAILLIFFLLSIILLCSCGIIANKEVESDSGIKYSVLDDTENKGEISFSGFSIKFSSCDELKKATTMTYDGEIKIASNVDEAAKIGATILEKCYNQWTETKTVIVDKNKNANAWIVTGQLSSRNSTAGLGAVVFSIETGEILYIGKDTPVS